MPRTDISMEVPLQYPLNEFLQALEAEIEAASRESASRAISLVDGRRIGQIGSGFQYVFHVGSPLNIPADSPAELHVDDHASVDATIISTDGLVVTLSLPQNLGATIPQAWLRSDLTFLLRKLMERIEDYSVKSNLAGERILGDREPAGCPEQLEATIFGSGKPNRKQEAAISSILGRDTTFISGPPGTGKTRTIGWIGSELYSRKRSMLLVSHTNIAVDHGLLAIAARLREAGRGKDLEEGKVLRVGEPQDSRFTQQPELLLSEQARRRSEKLRQRQDALETERTDLVGKVLSDQNTLDVLAWIEQAGEDLQKNRRCLRQVVDYEGQVHEKQESAREIQKQVENFEQYAAQARRLRERVTALESQLERLRASGEELQEDLDERRHKLSAEFTDLEQQVIANATRLKAEKSRLRETESRGLLMRRWKGLPKPELQRATVAELSAKLERVRGHAEQSRKALDTIDDQLSDLTLQLAALQTFQAYSELDGSAHGEVPSGPLDLTGLGSRLQKLTQELVDFRNSCGARPVELLNELSAADRELSRRKQLVASVTRQREQLRTELTQTVDEQFAALHEAGLFTRRLPADLGKRVELLEDLHAHVSAEYSHIEGQEVAARIRANNSRIVEVDASLREIEEALARVESDLIAEADLIATTLTRAYLRDYIQEREFDTVVLDEASMAPMPALWVASGVATRSVGIVGDPEQLPPIKHSNLDVAEKWLGRDIFTASGVMNEQDTHRDKSHLVRLTTQYRMHPDISAIPNHLVYRGELIDGPDTLDDSELDDFYDRSWGPDEPVVLLDTGPLDAWVTTVDRGSSTSRLNFLSAVICADLAQEALCKDRVPHKSGEKPRILIITPYRPQANLIALLLRHQKLQDEVAVGTVHSFQGKEASVVIFDLVVDEPHWRVGLFVPEYDDNNKRLLNVAFTRARRRLIVVGDLDYIASRGKKAFVGRLAEHLTRYTRLPAHEVLPIGLSARAAAAQLEAVGGGLEDVRDRLLVSATDYYRYLATDLATAEKRVVIYSPFMTPDRVSEIDPHFRELTHRGVPVYIVTKPLRERAKQHRNASRQMEEHLQRLGIRILHKRAMHEKVVLIDDEICWVGSLNTLSFSKTAEVMERRRSRDITRDYIKHLRIEELITVFDDEELSCPVCRSDMEAAEGNAGPYWRCENECFSRSLDQPYPHDGKLKCSSCGADVEFGYWGSEPHWRCTANRRHRQRVVRQHLELPKMLGIVPKRELRQLRSRWNMD